MTAETEAGADAAAYDAQNPPLYEPVPGWGLVPHGISFNGDANAVAVDSQDRVYVFNRGNKPVVVFDRDGNLVASWGEGGYINYWGEGPAPGSERKDDFLFSSPHSIFIDEDDHLWLVDTAAHVVQKRSPQGDLLLELGRRNESSEPGAGKPFAYPTDVHTHPVTKEIFVTDGYFNAVVHRFAPDGEYIASWGESGTLIGQFNNPHGVVVLEDDRVFVCDRYNCRIQVFNTSGEYLQDWNCFLPQAIRHWNGLLYVGEMDMNFDMWSFPNLGHAVSIFDTDGNRVARFGAPYVGEGPDQFISGPHCLALDSHGDFYSGECARTFLGGKQMFRFPHQEPLHIPRGETTSLRKWRLTGADTSSVA
jgi:DNA-binding beta-propeller fold protein YncE